MGKVTLADVAAAANVSKAAASFAFNQPDRLSEETLRRVLRAAEELGYVRDPMARMLRQGRMNSIGVLLPQDIPTVMANPYYSQFLVGIGAVCQREGLTLLLVPPLRGSTLKAIPHAAADGFIVCGLESDRGEVTTLNQRGVPMVLVDGEPVSGVSSVEVDDRAGAAAVCEYVLTRGHRRLGIVAFEPGAHDEGPRYRGPLARRLEGIGDALAAAGLSMDSPEVDLIEVPCNRSGGHQAFHRLWSSQPRPTAIIALSDILAMGVMDAAREAGVRIPEDVSVSGYDDQPEASWTTPGLTTVRQAVETKGRLAAELLVDSIFSRLDRSQQHRLPTTLVVRGSVGPAVPTAGPTPTPPGARQPASAPGPTASRATGLGRIRQ